MMKIEFTYLDVIEFLRLYSLFKEGISEREQTLIELGCIDQQSSYESAKQEYNKLILDNILYSNLIKNSFLEAKVKEITGNDIIIIDHSDESIDGISCIACGYIVFEDKESSFFEICPVCGWQNDGKIADEYSSCNHATLNEYKKESDFKDRVAQGSKIYLKS